ncbi:MAG: Gfo/Idh/MocA family protein, partial [Verrucomicrobiia bacterium]
MLTNLETTWYSSLHEAYRLAVEEKTLGKITKIVSYFGHSGPANMAPEFFRWLSDPVLNGGGASADFGCYGQNIITWMMGNRKPLSVTAIFQSNKPDVYREVDDNATIILEYPGAQGIIQASWDWPF